MVFGHDTFWRLLEDSMNRPVNAAPKVGKNLEGLREELQRAFAAPESAYVFLSDAEVIARNRRGGKVRADREGFGAAI